MAASKSSERLYDSYGGPQIDSKKWFNLEFPLPDGGAYVAEEPGAKIEFRDGAMTVAIKKFTKSHAFQPMDNCKFLVLSTDDFELPKSGSITFSATITVEPRKGTPYDIRDGFAALVVADMNTGAIFDMGTTGDVTFAIHEQLPYPGVDNPYTRVITDPLFGPASDRGKPVHCSITFDTAAKRVTWVADGHVVHVAESVIMPPAVKVGTGIFTVRPVEGTESKSLRGQGLTATWSDVRVPV